ncbi:nucleotidyltransferase family protein [Sphingopyxis indica]|nr:nucleotidyltransferase family protein [Sphingopyxis indica]
MRSARRVGEQAMIEPEAIAAVLLAAGRSQRFGARDKLAEPLGGVPLALHAARRIADLDAGVRIAVCAEESPLAGEFARLGFAIKVNAEPELGLSHSLALGIEAAAVAGARAALVLLGDMPFVRTDHLRALLAGFDPDEAPVVASAREGIAMPPALFARSLFDTLRDSSGDRGGRALLGAARLVAAPAAELADIDRPADLR